MKKRILKKQKILYEGDFLQLVREGPWEYVQRKNCSGVVVIVPLTQDEKAVFVEQRRVPVGGNVIEFPAGLVEDHNLVRRESLEAAAQRELLEETGYHAEHLEHLVSGPAASGLSCEIVAFYRACCLEKRGPGGGVELESILVHEIPLKRAEVWLKRMEKKGKRIDPKVYIGIYFLNAAVRMRHSKKKTRLARRSQAFLPR